MASNSMPVPKVKKELAAWGGYLGEEEDLEFVRWKTKQVGEGSKVGVEGGEGSKIWRSPHDNVADRFPGDESKSESSSVGRIRGFVNAILVWREYLRL